MDAELYDEAIKYEQLTKATYQAILRKEGVNTIEVQHNIKVKGRSGVEHQIDVYWSFIQAGIEHKVVIECKNYASSISLEKVRNIFGVLHDIGSAQGLMVTKTGYQSGAADFAKYYNIGLKILRKPIDDDWQGRVKNININLIAKSVISTKDKPLTASLYIQPIDDAQEKRIEILKQAGRFNVQPRPDLRFLDKDGLPASEEMKWWLPSKLEVLHKEDGGPYTQRIELDNKFVMVNEGEPDQELIKVIGVIATFFVESATTETTIYGEDIVEAILKDFNTNEVEHIKRI